MDYLVWAKASKNPFPVEMMRENETLQIAADTLISGQTT